MKEKAEEELAKAGIKATVLYYGPSGSTLHGRFSGKILFIYYFIFFIHYLFIYSHIYSFFIYLFIE